MKKSRPCEIYQETLGSIRASGARAGDTAEVRARGKTKIGREKKNVSPLDSDVFPASHEGRRDAVLLPKSVF